MLTPSGRRRRGQAAIGFDSRRQRDLIISEKIAHLGTLCDQYRKATGLEPRQGHSLIVAPDGAVSFMRDVFSGLGGPKVTFTNDPDELFVYDRVPVRLRYDAPCGVVLITRQDQTTARRCCDEASMTSILVALKRGTT